MAAPEILAAAVRVVTKDGAQALTMQRLVEETGLSRATLYRQGGSLEALLDAVAKSGTDVGDRADTRTRIVSAAREVFSRAGFEAATMEGVAAAAGLGVATVYRYFGDKDGLITAVLDDVAPRRAVREARAALSGDIRHDLEAVATRVLAGMRDDSAVVRLMLLEALRGGPALARARATSEGRSLATIATLLREHVAAGTLRGADPEALAQAFAGMLFAFGVLGPVMRAVPAPEPAETARMLTELFLGGALATGGER